MTDCSVYGLFLQAQFVSHSQWNGKHCSKGPLVASVLVAILTTRANQQLPLNRTCRPQGLVLVLHGILASPSQSSQEIVSSGPSQTLKSQFCSLGVQTRLPTMHRNICSTHHVSKQVPSCRVNTQLAPRRTILNTTLFHSVRSWYDAGGNLPGARTNCFSHVAS